MVIYMEFYVFGFKISIISLAAIIISLCVIIHNRFSSIKGQEGDKVYVRINLDENTYQEFYIMDDSKFIKFLKRIFKFKS